MLSSGLIYYHVTNKSISNGEIQFEQQWRSITRKRLIELSCHYRLAKGLHRIEAYQHHRYEIEALATSTSNSLTSTDGKPEAAAGTCTNSSSSIKSTSNLCRSTPFPCCRLFDKLSPRRTPRRTTTSWLSHRQTRTMGHR